jgi:hypothetical protein
MEPFRFIVRAVLAVAAHDSLQLFLMVQALPRQGEADEINVGILTVAFRHFNE